MATNPLKMLTKVRHRLATPSESTVTGLSQLAQAFEADLVPDAPNGEGEPVILVGDPGLARERSERPGQAIYLPQVSPEAGEPIDSYEVVADLPGAPWMRGRTLRLPNPIRVQPLPLYPGSMVMARGRTGPVWVRERESGMVRDRVAFPMQLRERSRDRAGLELVDEAAFPTMLPLMEFLRELNGEAGWYSTLKACFMFDDPNLHVGSYGFLDFHKVGEEARRHRYHVSFATVPLDGWFASARGVAAFRQEGSPLSLLIHGNDHLHQELNQEHDDKARLAMLAQALRRIERLEGRTGLRVCRVMAPPHGLCRDRVMRCMARLEFDAASISNGSLRLGDENTTAVKVMGLRPAEIIEGLPVLSRFQFSKNSLQQFLLSAYLGQPLIPTGHHEDVSAGLEILNELAGQINGLGPVEWMRMSEIARKHYQWRMVGDTLAIRPYSRLLQVMVPEGVSHLRVEPRTGMLTGDVTYHLACKRQDPFHAFQPDEGIEVSGGSTVWIRIRDGESLDFHTVPEPRRKLWPIGRRLACEVRDQLKPWLKRG